MSYAYERMPPSPDREIVESTAHSVLGTLSGEVAALTIGQRDASACRSQTNPLATGESRSWNGLTLGGSLRRELGHSSVAELQLDPRERALGLRHERLLREQLGHPVAHRSRARSRRGCAAAVGFLRNAYPNDAPGLGGAPPGRHRRLERSASGATSAGAPGCAPTTAGSAATPTCPTST